MAARHLSGEVGSVELLQATHRAVVMRFLTEGSSVVVKHFRRRDSANNASGFGYLRARHGCEALPSCVRLLAHDDVDRLIVVEDLGDRIFEPRSAQDMLRWIGTWPDLVVPASSAPSLRFRQALAAADPIAAASRRPGALPSLGLLERGGLPLSSVEDFIDPHRSVLWCGDMNPSNFAESGDDGYLQIDTEGTGYCDPALLVAEVAFGLPLAPRHHEWRAMLAPGQWAEASEFLAEHWHVTTERARVGAEALKAVVGQLAPGRSDIFR